MVREMVSDMMTGVEAARALLYRSAEVAPINDERARAFRLDGQGCSAPTRP